jgi:hypothetical protein
LPTPLSLNNFKVLGETFEMIIAEVKERGGYKLAKGI